jgi:hypothetical protein
MCRIAGVAHAILLARRRKRINRATSNLPPDRMIPTKMLAGEAGDSVE